MRVLVQLPPPLHALEMTCPERSNVPIPLSIAASGQYTPIFACISSANSLDDSDDDDDDDG
jgi:hypothetical protein